MNPHRSVLVLAVLLAAVPASAEIVPDSSIQTDIRAAVWIQYSSAPGSLAEGIVDTGDPRLTLSRETASFLGIIPNNPLTNRVAPPPYPQNQGAAPKQTLTAGGWYGAALYTPERTSVTPAKDPQVRNGDPAHVFSSNPNQSVGNTAPQSSFDLYPFYRDFPAGSGGYSESHLGMPFLTRANPASNLVMGVDPINGSALPFAYDSTNGGNGRGLGAASLPTDRLSSSVSFFQPGDDRVPDPFRNANPGFVTFVDLTAREFPSSTLTPAASLVTVKPEGVPRMLTVYVSPADAARTAKIIPAEYYSGTGDIQLSPGYKPATAAGDVIEPASWKYEVNSATLAIGGQRNPNGFERRDGDVYIQLRDTQDHFIGNYLVSLPSQAPRPYGSINMNSLNIHYNNCLIDTGAPSSDSTLIGTDVLNRFGQFFDFRRTGTADGRLTLIGPTDPAVRRLVSNGILFAVTPDTQGLTRTAVNQEYTTGEVPVLIPGGSPQMPTGARPGEARATIFRTNATGSNATYINEEALYLQRGTSTIDEISLGADPIGLPAQTHLYFSVGVDSCGLNGSVVRQQYWLNQQAADIYHVPPGWALQTRTPQSGAHTLLINQEVMGLGPNCGPSAAAPVNNENLNSLDLYTQLALPANSMSNQDPPLRTINDAGYTNRGRVGAERYGTNFDTYFTMDAPTGQAGGARIFGSVIYQPFAEPSQMGLGNIDDIDGLALWRPGVAPRVRVADDLRPGSLCVLTQADGLLHSDSAGGYTFDPNYHGDFWGIDAFWGGSSDLALFSLSPDSPILDELGLCGADIFITDFDGTFALYATAESLGLNGLDDIDALDSMTEGAIAALPEPGSLCLLVLGTGPLLLRRRRGTPGPPSAPF